MTLGDCVFKKDNNLYGIIISKEEKYTVRWYEIIDWATTDYGNKKEDEKDLIPFNCTCDWINRAKEYTERYINACLRKGCINYTE